MLWMRMPILDKKLSRSDYVWLVGRRGHGTEARGGWEARLLKKWICMKCSATHRGSKPGSCRKCGYKNFRPKVH